MFFIWHNLFKVNYQAKFSLPDIVYIEINTMGLILEKKKSFIAKSIMKGTGGIQSSALFSYPGVGQISMTHAKMVSMQRP